MRLRLCNAAKVAIAVRSKDAPTRCFFHKNATEPLVVLYLSLLNELEKGTFL
jgi:hypothetical protein